MFGTTKKLTKSGPSDPIFITKILKRIQENDGRIIEKLHHLSYLRIRNSENVGRCAYLTFVEIESWEFEVFENFKIVTLGILNLKFGDLDLLIYESWELGICKIRHL